MEFYETVHTDFVSVVGLYLKYVLLYYLTFTDLYLVFYRVQMYVLITYTRISPLPPEVTTW